MSRALDRWAPLGRSRVGRDLCGRSSHKSSTQVSIRCDARKCERIDPSVSHFRPRIGLSRKLQIALLLGRRQATPLRECGEKDCDKSHLFRHFRSARNFAAVARRQSNRKPPDTSANCFAIRVTCDRCVSMVCRLQARRVIDHLWPGRK